MSRDESWKREANNTETLVHPILAAGQWVDCMGSRTCRPQSSRYSSDQRLGFFRPREYQEAFQAGSCSEAVFCFVSYMIYWLCSRWARWKQLQFPLIYDRRGTKRGWERYTYNFRNVNDGRSHGPGCELWKRLESIPPKRLTLDLTETFDFYFQDPNSFGWITYNRKHYQVCQSTIFHGIYSFHFFCTTRFYNRKPYWDELPNFQWIPTAGSSTVYTACLG